jgi:DNA-binding Xre family transcriptional regulator
MAASYKKLFKLLIDRDMRKGELCRLSGVSSTSIAKLAKGESVTTDILVRICKALNCDFSDIMQLERDDGKAALQTIERELES